MNLKDLETRKTDLTNKLETLIANRDKLVEALKQSQGNIQMMHGAIQDCEYWIGKIGTIPSKKNNKKEKIEENGVDVIV